MQVRHFIIVFLLIVCCSNAMSQVVVTGAMRDVMWKGQLSGKISMDTILSGNRTYGIGPVEGLAGEIMVFNGIPYTSQVISESAMVVIADSTVRAPFFVHSNVTQWKKIQFPPTVTDLKSLEAHLSEISLNTLSPFVFRIEGKIQDAVIHVVNLPSGSIVQSPDDAHKGQQNFNIANTASSVIGFFSREHKGIFTHHDSFLHMHLLTNDKKMMGHVDKLTFHPSDVEVYISF